MSATITVLGVGNPIMGDDGIGLALLERLRESRPDGRIDYVDGGTGGMELLSVVQDASRLLILDAVAGTSLGAAPGTVLSLSGDQVPRMLSTKLSPHQVGLLDVFAAARLLGSEPGQVEVIGIVPADVDLRLGMSPAIAAALPDAVVSAEGVLDRWLADQP